MENTDKILEVETPVISQTPTRPAPFTIRTWITIDTGNWGRLPILCLIGAVGLALVSIADTLARSGMGRYELLFWLGLSLLVGPIGGRLASRAPTRRERIGLVMVLGLGLYLVKIMHSPQAFTFSDELIHYFNGNRILETGRLFSPNPILPVTPSYPGLETVTASLSSLSGLNLFDSGIIVLGVARLVTMLALFLFVEQISRSAHVAGMAALLYTAHANFLFWSVQYSYESLALPLAIFVLYLAARRADTTLRSQRVALTLAALIGIEAVVITHHLTSYFLVVFLICWALIVRFRIHVAMKAGALGVVSWYAGETALGQLVRGYGQRLRSGAQAARARGLKANVKTALENRGGPGDLALMALGSALLWQILIASATSSYLAPVLSRAFTSIIQIIIGESTARELFQSEAGYTAPILERLIAFGSVLLLALGVPFGLRKIWQQYRHHPVATLLAGATLLYFAMLALRFSPAAWETGNRASEFVFLGVAFVLALALIEWWNSPNMTRIGQVLIMASIALIFMGGIIAGWPPLLRLSRPLQVKVDQLKIEPQGMATTRWLRSVLGPDHTLIADESNGRLLLAYGGQNPLVGRNLNVNEVIGAELIEDWHLELMREQQVEYVLVDRRRVSWNNMAGYYFDEPESEALVPKGLFAPEIYEKFDSRPEVGRLLDSGNIVIYDVRTLRNVTSVK
ncbi:hypothetical protein TFLX_00363 [Thermoflexales bacterium]|nr:hypothetical protein TFLX_00363 [Thermoflexales bacterium]